MVFIFMRSEKLHTKTNSHVSRALTYIKKRYENYLSFDLSL